MGDVPLGNDVVDGLGDAVGMVVQTKVTKEHGAGEQESGGVGLVLALDVEADVTAARLEDGNVTAHVATGDDTRATDEGGANVGQNATVQVGHDHDVELLGLGDTLHAGIVDNHVVVLEGRVLLGDTGASVAEETVGQLHDVGLVDAGDLLTAVGQGEGEGELGNALRLGAGDDLERLDDTGHTLVLQTAVLSLGVLTDDAKVDVLVAGVVAGNVLDKADGGVDVELLAHGNVETLVAGSADGGVKDALQAQLVPLKRSDRLAEGGLGTARRARVDTRHIDLLPVNGDVVGLEDGLDALGDLGTDAVTGDQGDCVLAAELGGLEHVRLDGGVGPGGSMGLLVSSSPHQALK